MVFHIQGSALTSCSDVSEIVRIPYGVEKFVCWAFRNDKTIREVYFPETVVEVEDSTFKECTSLQKVVLPDSLRRIGEGVFSYCLNLEEVTLGSNVEEIAYGAFFACSKLKNINLPGCTEEGIHLPAELHHIGNGAFNECTSIKAVTLPEHLQTIGNYAFCSTGITELALPKELRRAGPGILQDCRVHHLTILAQDTELQEICKEEDLQADAMLTADDMELEGYPRPFQAIHGLLSFAVRHASGEDIPVEVEAVFRKYLGRHYLRYLDEPEIFALVLDWKVIDLQRMEGALRKAGERNNPAVVAALLQYQHEIYSQTQVDEAWQRKIQVVGESL